MIEIQPPIYNIGGATITIGQKSVHKINPSKNVSGGMVRTNTRPNDHIINTMTIGIQRIMISHPMFFGIIFVALKSVQ